MMVRIDVTAGGITKNVLFVELLNCNFRELI